MPDVIISCDWSLSSKKRWGANAIRAGSDSFLLHAPWQVTKASQLVDRARAAATSAGWAFLGFDNPIGVPRQYASAASIARFTEWFSALAATDWREFSKVCEKASEVRTQRPFYPRAAKRAGQVSRDHLIAGLGLQWDELLRRCERQTQRRNEACSLFWTLGGNQVGKAALAMWGEVLRPALLQKPGASVWPFDGRLPALLRPGAVILAETYPAETYHHIGVALGGKLSKRRQPDRRAQSAAIMGWIVSHGLSITPEAEAAVRDGFGTDANGEDRFDAFLGLLGMLEVVLGIVPDGVPAGDPEITACEGWILGQQDAP